MLRCSATLPSSNKTNKKKKKKVSILPPHGRVGFVGAWVPLRL
jgi:hypothetical protein